MSNFMLLAFLCWGNGEEVVTLTPRSTPVYKEKKPPEKKFIRVGVKKKLPLLWNGIQVRYVSTAVKAKP